MFSGLDFDLHLITGKEFLEQPGRVFAPFHIHRRNLDSPQHFEDQAIVETVTFSGKMVTEEGQARFCQPMK